MKSYVLLQMSVKYVISIGEFVLWGVLLCCFLIFHLRKPYESDLYASLSGPQFVGRKGTGWFGTEG